MTNIVRVSVRPSVCPFMCRRRSRLTVTAAKNSCYRWKFNSVVAHCKNTIYGCNLHPLNFEGNMPTAGKFFSHLLHFQYCTPAVWLMRIVDPQSCQSWLLAFRWDQLVACLQGLCPQGSIQITSFRFFMLNIIETSKVCSSFFDFEHIFS